MSERRELAAKSPPKILPERSSAFSASASPSSASLFFQGLRHVCPEVFETAARKRQCFAALAESESLTSSAPTSFSASASASASIAGDLTKHADGVSSGSSSSLLTTSNEPNKPTGGGASHVPKVPKRTAAASEGATDHGGCRLFVGGLPQTATDDDLRQYFERFGSVTAASVIVYGDSKKPRGFGFVTFADVSSARAVLGHSELHRIHGKVVECASARPRAPTHPRFVVLDNDLSDEEVAAMMVRRAQRQAQWEESVRKNNPWCEYLDKLWPVDEKVDSFICGRPYRPFEVPASKASAAPKRPRKATVTHNSKSEESRNKNPTFKRQSSTERRLGVEELSDDVMDSSASDDDAGNVAEGKPPAPQKLNDRLADYFTNVATIFKNRQSYSHGKTGPVTNDNFRAGYYMSLAAALRRSTEPVDRAEKIRRIAGGRFAHHPKLVVRLREALLILNTRMDANQAGNDDGSAGVSSKHMPVADARAHAVENLMTAWGVGPTVAKELLRKGIRSVAELQQHAAASSSSRASATGNKAKPLWRGRMSTGAIAALPYTAEINQRIPRAEVTAIGNVVHAAALQIAERRGANASRIRFEICGSYRRGNKSSGDVDILITDTRGSPADHCFLGELVRNLSAEGFLVAHLVSLPIDPLPDSSGQGGSSEGSVFGAASGNGGSPMRQVDLMGARAPEFKKQSYMGICRLGPNGTARRIDIKTYPVCQYPFALLYFTGSAHFNRSMRLFAKKKNIKLTDEHLIERGGRHRRWNCASEGEIFAALKLPFREPAERNCPTDK